MEEHAVEIIVEGREVEKKRDKTIEREQRKGEKEGSVMGKTVKGEQKKK